MGAFSDYLRNAVINTTLRDTAFPAAPANVYVALFNTDPGNAGAGTELSGNGYARTAVSTTGGFSAPSNGTTSNISAITFAAATADWATANYFALFDAVSGGNLLFHGSLASPQTVLSGNVLQFNAGALTVTLA